MQRWSRQKHNRSKYRILVKPARFQNRSLRCWRVWPILANISKQVRVTLRNIDIKSKHTNPKISKWCKMHVVWVRCQPASRNERANGIINCVTVITTNLMELTRLFNSRYATRHGRCKSKLMRINKIRWSYHRDNPTKTIIYWCTKRNTNVPRPASKNT